MTVVSTHWRVGSHTQLEHVYL